MSLAVTIAGHTFSFLNGLCSCGKRFGDIAAATRDDIGQKGWAHSGDLTEHEYGQIVSERDRLWRAHLESGVD